jgi:hypothetical protein
MLSKLSKKTAPRRGSEEAINGLTWIIFKYSARSAQQKHRLGYDNQSLNL